MSALLAPNPRPKTRPVASPQTPGPRLRPLAAPPRRLARLPFLAVLIAAFGIGMAGLLMLNTTLQNQAFQARTLNRQALELTYVQANLESQLDDVAAPASLAQKASALGMRANPYPAFLVLPSGKVVGDPKPVKGDELSELVVKTPAQLAAEQRAAQAKAQNKAAGAAQQTALDQLDAQQAAVDAQAKAVADAARAKATADAQAKADAAAKTGATKTAARQPTGNGKGH